jgi:hypothetical protein
MYRTLIIISLVALSFGIHTARTEASIGFPTTNIFIDNQEVLEGDPVTIFVVLNRASEEVKEITVAFMDNNEVFATTSVSFFGSEQLKILEQRFVPEAGDHMLHARIQEEDWESRTGVSDKTISLHVFTDKDTDNDGIGNREDLDDDGDSIPDTDDPEPLVAQKKSLLSDWISQFTATSTEEAALESDESLPLGSFVDSHDDAEAATSSRALASVVNTIKKVEDMRKNTAATINAYEDQEIAKIEEIKREAGNTDVDEYDSHKARDMRSSQIAAAAAAITGTIFDHMTLFYLHIIMVVYGFVHTAWSFIKKKYHVHRIGRFG